MPGDGDMDQLKTFIFDASLVDDNLGNLKNKKKHF